MCLTCPWPPPVRRPPPPAPCPPVRCPSGSARPWRAPRSRCPGTPAPPPASPSRSPPARIELEYQQDMDKWSRKNKKRLYLSTGCWLLQQEVWQTPEFDEYLFFFDQIRILNIIRFSKITEYIAQRSIKHWPNITSYLVSMEDGGGNGGK